MKKRIALVGTNIDRVVTEMVSPVSAHREITV